MKIVVLDGYTLNPGDLTWEALQALGECDAGRDLIIVHLSYSNIPVFLNITRVGLIPGNRL